MKAQELMRVQYAQAHQMLESAIKDCDAEALTKVVGGNIGTVGAIYAHAVFDEDGWVAGVTGNPTLWTSGGWAQATLRQDSGGDPGPLWRADG